MTAKDDIIAAYRAGEPIAAIAARHGITKGYVSYLARQAGVLRRPIATDRPERHAARNDEIEAAYRAGETLSALASRYGLTPDAIARILSKRDVPRGVRRGYGGRWTAEDDAYLLAHRHEPTKVVAEALDRPVSSVLLHWRRLTGQRRFAERNAAMRAARREGMTYREIAEHFGVSWQVAYTVCRDA